MLALLTAAAGTSHDAAPPGPSTGLWIIVGVLVVLALGALAMHFGIARGSKASKGGVQPPPQERGTRHAPPFESIERRS